MVAAVASMSDMGWITSPPHMADRLLSYAFLSDATQSYFYPGEITSVQYLLQQYGEDIPGLIKDMTGKLETLFAPHFDTVQVQITSNFGDPAISKVTLTVSVNVTVGGVASSVVTEVQSINSILVRVFNQINTGSLT